jgi:hypothetical protein
MIVNLIQILIFAASPLSSSIKEKEQKLAGLELE